LRNFGEVARVRPGPRARDVAVVRPKTITADQIPLSPVLSKALAPAVWDRPPYPHLSPGEKAMGPNLAILG